ncbi:MAG: YncE family protein, partial [Candidatus Nitrosopolaris sp.]
MVDLLSVNMLTKKLYVANSGSNTVSVIDYFISQSGNFKNTNRTDIQVGSSPIDVNINWRTNQLYTLSSVIDGTVSVIDGSTYKKITRDIPVGSFPTALYVNPNTQVIYVTNAGSGTVSVIDGSTYKKMPDIKVGGSPLAVSFNPDTRVLYVTDTASHNVKLLSSNNLLVGINFNIKPSSAGNIQCNTTTTKKISNNY